MVWVWWTDGRKSLCLILDAQLPWRGEPKTFPPPYCKSKCCCFQLKRHGRRCKCLIPNLNSFYGPLKLENQFTMKGGQWTPNNFSFQLIIHKCILPSINKSYHTIQYNMDGWWHAPRSESGCYQSSNKNRNTKPHLRCECLRSRYLIANSEVPNDG